MVVVEQKNPLQNRIKKIGLDKALKLLAKKYLEKHLIYKKRKFLEFNTSNLLAYFFEVYYAGVQEGIDTMTDNLKSLYETPCDLPETEEE